MFSPYHTFSGCKFFQDQIARCKANGTLPQVIAASHDLYHYSMLHKLRSAKYHVETLKSYLATVDPSADDIPYRVNFHFDGFLHVMGSGADIFAREILGYFAVVLPANVYYQTAENQLNLHKAGDPIIPFLESPIWRDEFSRYRNTATHESLIGREYNIRVEVQGGRQIRRLQFPVPDDPRINPRTYQKNPDIVEYCRISYSRWLRLFNKTYQHMAQRIKAGAIPPF